MRNDAIELEETRLNAVTSLEDYGALHERHRIFPEVFEGRGHRRILDLAAGVGCAAQRIKEQYEGEIYCNDVTPKCLEILNNNGLTTVSFDIDVRDSSFPFPDRYFDAILSLATIEHVIHLDEHLQEIRRILNDEGYLYISSPNYASLIYMRPLLMAGKSFHDPLVAGDQYEFYAHVRYFTYRTLLEFVSNFGFVAEAVYLPLPKESAKFLKLQEKSRLKALGFKYSMWFIYRFLSPRWASEPVICFRKSSNGNHRKIQKIVL